MNDDMCIFKCGCGNTAFNITEAGTVECPNCDIYFTDVHVKLPEGIRKVNINEC